MKRLQTRILLALFAIFLIPQGMWAVDYNISIAGTIITDGNAGDVFGDQKVSFTPATGTAPNILRLNNYSETSKEARIVSGLDNLTIEFSGSNVLGQNSRYYGIIQSTVSTAVLTLKGIPGSTAPSTLDLNSFNDHSVIEGFERVDLDEAYFNFYQPFSFGSFKDWQGSKKKGYLVHGGLLHGLTITTEVCYPIWVNDDGYNLYQMTAANPVVGGATFSVRGSTNTLTMNSINLAQIVSGLDNLTIDLEGDNSIAHPYGDTATVIRSINENGTLTFKKSGSSASLTLHNLSNSIYSIISGFKSIDYNGLYLNTSAPPQYKSIDVSDVNYTSITNSLVNVINDDPIHGATINTTETYPLWVNGLQVTSANAGSIENGNPSAAAGIGISANASVKPYSVKYANNVLEFDNVHLTSPNTNYAIVSGLADLTVKFKGLSYFTGANTYFRSVKNGKLTFTTDEEDAAIEMVNHVSFEGFATVDYNKAYLDPTKGLATIGALKAPTMSGTEGTGGQQVTFTSNNVPSGVNFYYTIDYADETADVGETPITMTSYGNGISGTMTLSGPGVVTAYAKFSYSGGTASSTQGTTRIGKYFSFATRELTTPYQPTINAPNIVPALPSGVTVTYSNSAAATPVNSINSSTGVITINGITPASTPDNFYAVFSNLGNVDFALLNSPYGQTDFSLGSFKLTVVKADGTISYATTSITKTFGDAAFTNALTKTGDGTVSYSSSNTAVATVNATTGEVTIVGVGSSVITATVTDGANYTYSPNTATYTLTVGSASMNVSASGYTGKYDGQAHGIKVTAPDGATVKYGEHDGTYDLNTSPAYTNAGSYTVYYQVTKPGYNPVTGSATVVISKADAKVKYVNYEFSAKIGENFDPPYLTLDPSDLVVSYYSYDTSVATVDAQTGEVTLVAPGTVNIYASFAGNENYNSASDYYILTVLQRDIEPIDEDVTITMKDDDFLTTNDEGQQEEIKLDNTVIYDILYTLNIVGDPSECDGYDETEHCVVLNHPMTSKEINRIVSGSLEPGSEAYADAYTGLTFKVPDGKGYVIIDSKTDGNYQMMVKIGTLAPVAFNHTGREKDSVFYECSKPTWVYVYDGGMVSNARMAVDHRAKKTKGHVKIYSVTRSSSQAAGIERVNSDALESDRWYDLQGNRIQHPTKKGLYILEDRKIVVK